MPIAPYLKEAAAQLRRAAQTCKQESNEVRTTSLQTEISANKAKADIQRRIGVVRQDLKHADDTESKSVRAKELQELEQNMTEVDRQLKENKQQFEKVIHQKEEEMDDLIRRASELENRAAYST